MKKYSKFTNILSLKNRSFGHRLVQISDRQHQYQMQTIGGVRTNVGKELLYNRSEALKYYEYIMDVYFEYVAVTFFGIIIVNMIY